MGLSIANILLQVTGDSDDARRELEAVSRDLALFGRETAEAEVDLNTEGARANLDELEASLADFSTDDHSTEINVLIAKAQADIAVLQAELTRIDKEEVTVDVDVRRGVVEKISALTGEIDRIGVATEQAAQGGISSFVSSLGEAWKGASIFGVSLSTIALAAPLVITVLVALAAAVVAVAASLVEAVAGVGALAVAFGAALVPGIALGIGALLRFKDQADEAGTAAHALKGAAGDFGDAFKSATAGGADAVFRGIADALKGLAPVVKELGPAFTELGKAGGDAFRLLGKQFASPEWRSFFKLATDSLTELTPLFTRSFGAFAGILRDVASAAMPFLIAGFKDVASWLEKLGDKTSNVKDLRSGIGGLVDHLKEWLRLGKGLGESFLGFLEAVAPQGKEFVSWLADGAEEFAKWTKSKEGREAIRSFFDDVLPVAKEAIKFFGKVGVAVLQVAQFFAPLVAGVLSIASAIVDWVIGAIGWLKKLDRALTFDKIWDAIKSGASAVGDAISSAFSDAVDWARDAVDKVKGFLSAPIKFVLDFASDIAQRARSIWDSVKGVVEDAIKFVLQFASDLPSRARGIWSAVKGAVTDAIKFVLQFASDLAGRARNIWGDVKGVVSDAINFVLSLPGDLAARARTVWSAVKGVIEDAIDFVLDLPGVGGLVSAAKAIWDAINDALPDISIDIHIPKPSLPDIPGLAGGVRDKPTSGINLVGEEGPELRFNPKGVDIFTATETQRILRALAGGISAPAAVATAVAPAGGGQTVNNVSVEVVSPGTGSPDPDIAAAKWNASLRARGALA